MPSSPYTIPGAIAGSSAGLLLAHLLRDKDTKKSNIKRYLLGLGAGGATGAMLGGYAGSLESGDTYGDTGAKARAKLEAERAARAKGDQALPNETLGQTAGREANEGLESAMNGPVGHGAVLGYGGVKTLKAVIGASKLREAAQATVASMSPRTLARTANGRRAAYEALRTNKLPQNTAAAGLAATLYVENLIDAIPGVINPATAVRRADDVGKEVANYHDSCWNMAKGVANEALHIGSQSGRWQGMLAGLAKARGDAAGSKPVVALNDLQPGAQKLYIAGIHALGARQKVPSNVAQRHFDDIIANIRTMSRVSTQEATVKAAKLLKLPGLEG